MLCTNKNRKLDTTLIFRLGIGALVASCLSSCSSSVDSSDSTSTSMEIVETSYLASCGSEDWNKNIEPPEIYINSLSPCMANGVGDKIEITSWTSWTAESAVGVGRFGVNTYEPDGAAENYEFYDITILLDAPVNGFFSRMHLSWIIQPPTASSTYQVQPMTYQEGMLLYGPEASCDGDLGWRYNDSLPIEYCDQGRGVSYIQNALGLESDGNFGAETWIALGKFQLANGLTEFLSVGPETWLKLFPYQAGLPGFDINKDGLVTPDEFGE